MSHENAPATKMLATNCCVCSRPLVDAKSVELGIGPICRGKHGFDIDCTDEDRQAANKLVHEVALEWEDEGFRIAACCELRLLGFTKLARRIEFRGKDKPRKEKKSGKRNPKNLVVVEVHTLPSTTYRGRLIPERKGFLVRTPYREASVSAWQRIAGRCWLPSAKANFVPTKSRAALWELLRAHYKGMNAVGPKGDFVVA